MFKCIFDYAILPVDERQDGVHQQKGVKSHQLMRWDTFHIVHKNTVTLLMPFHNRYKKFIVN